MNDLLLRLIEWDCSQRFQEVYEDVSNKLGV